MPPVLAPALREVPALARVAGPLVLAQLAQNAMGLVDTLMAGRLGPDALAGIALGAIVQFTFTLSVGAVLFAVSPMTAQALGAGREEEAAGIARHALVLALLLALPVMLLLGAAGPLLPHLGQDPVTSQLTGAYLGALLWGVPGYMLVVALRGTLEGRGHTRPIMVVAAGGVALNTLGNAAFMFGRWGFPELGLAGAGVSTAIAYSAMALALALIVRGHYRRPPIFAVEPLRRERFLELLRLGVPIGLTVAFEVGLFSVTGLFMGWFGPTALAGHQIALQTCSFTFMIPMGLAMATTARVGRAAGRGDAAGVRAAGLAGMGLASLVMLLTATAFWTVPRAIAGLYLDLGDPATLEVAATAATFLRIAAFFQLVDGLQVTAIGALRGLKDTRVPMLVTLVSYWFIGVTSGLVLAFGLGLAGVGLWIGLVIGLGAAAIMLALRYARLVRHMAPVSG
jgi:multidrug resistance protein, MATE family